MREDGVKLDQFVLTTDANFTLSPCHPPLSPTPGGSPMRVSRLNNGDVKVEWDGPGCRLQCSSTLGAGANWQVVATASPYTASPPIGIQFYRLISP